jgi:hypothetical protein
MKLLCTLLLVLLTVLAGAKELTGKVVAIEGSATTQTKGKKSRKLQRGSSVFTNEMIHVQGDSKLQIRFTDGGLLNLIPNTKYQIHSYNYSENKTTNQYVGQIYTGGFRHLTGGISKTNPEQMTIRTPTATIGVRGTTFEVLILPNQAMTVGCELGQISLANPAGSITLGPSAHFQYSTISSISVRPEGLASRPANFSEKIFTSPGKGIETNPKGNAAPTPPPRIKGGC